MIRRKEKSTRNIENVQIPEPVMSTNARIIDTLRPPTSSRRSATPPFKMVQLCNGHRSFSCSFLVLICSQYVTVPYLLRLSVRLVSDGVRISESGCQSSDVTAQFRT